MLHELLCAVCCVCFVGFGLMCLCHLFVVYFDVALFVCLCSCVCVCLCVCLVYVRVCVLCAIYAVMLYGVFGVCCLVFVFCCMCLCLCDLFV